jgi:hypothetical protein
MYYSLSFINLQVDLVQPNEKPYAFKKINVTIMQKSADYSSISYNYKSLSNDSFFLTSDVNGRLNFSFFVEPNVTNVEITVTLDTLLDSENNLI